MPRPTRSGHLSAVKGGKLESIGLFAAAGGLGPLVLRGLAKIGAFVPIFDWGSFYFKLPQS